MIARLAFFLKKLAGRDGAELSTPPAAAAAPAGSGSGIGVPMRAPNDGAARTAKAGRSPNSAASAPTSAAEAAKNPASLAAAATAAPTAAGPAGSATGAEMIPLLLKTITDQFPPDLQGVLRKQPSQHVRIDVPREKVESQLARGSVRLTFAELRSLTPRHFFSENTAFDSTAVCLPLGEILTHIKPARRTDQKHAPVPTDIAPVFARAGCGMIPPAAAGDGLPSWYAPARPTILLPAETPGTAPAMPDGPETPALPARESSGTAAPAATAIAIPAPAPATTAAVSSPPALATARAETVDLPLAAIMPALPERVKRTCTVNNVAGIRLRVPLPELELRMSRGKAVFDWRELLGWCDAPAPFTEEHTDATVELPLPVTIPLFMAAKKRAANAAASPARRLADAAGDIPDLFTAAAKPAKEPVAPVPVTVASASAAEFLISAPTGSEFAPAGEGKTVEAVAGEKDAPAFVSPATLAAGPEKLPALPLSAPVLPAEAPGEAFAPDGQSTPDATHPLGPELGTESVPEQMPLADASAALRLAPPASADASPSPLPSASSSGQGPNAPASPGDIIFRACEIEHVAGAFIGTHDGLLVAGQVPGTNGNMLAAFAPKLFAQLTACASLARLSPPQSLVITLADRSLGIHRCEKLFLGAISEPGRPLATGELAPLAAQLSTLSKL